MSSSLAIPREMPRHDFRFTASIEDLPYGAVLVTIGHIPEIYLNAAPVRAWLEEKQRAGFIRLEQPKASSC